MPTDAERREVARRLREIRPCRSGHIEWWTIAKALDLKESAGWFGWEKFEPDSVNRLADLIEPSDRNDELCVHCDYCDYCDLPKCSDQDGYSFKPKGYVDLLVLADKTIRTARHDMEICGDTVPAWYAAGRLEAVARNIREILEVES